MAEPVKAVCGAPTKNGGACQRPPGVSGRCPQHQVDAPSESGRWGKAVPSRLLDRYQLSVNDPEQLAMRHEIGLLDARLEDLLRRLDTGESGDAWTRLRKVFAEFQKALENDDEDKVKQKAAALDEIINEGAGDDAAWEAVLALLDQRHKLVDGEQKRQITGKTMLRADDATAFVDAMIQSVRLHVKDSDALAAIGADFARLTAP
jgi:hypothetical protein